MSNENKSEEEKISTKEKREAEKFERETAARMEEAARVVTEIEIMRIECNVMIRRLEDLKKWLIAQKK